MVFFPQMSVNNGAKLKPKISSKSLSLVSWLSLKELETLLAYVIGVSGSWVRML